ncbi:ATP synthase subunit O, mitochondrial [Cichlidogyrus casuarinus]|uniref:Oligomycin sensitivity conferral protein n=1 Tax=Cichlidogyrus casuarinus TaxID=1844966 RepID=A0ABD2Q1N0_9PLAT
MLQFVSGCKFIVIFRQVRKLSTTTASKALVKAPCQVHGIEGKYATALYSAAHKNKALDAVEKDMMKIEQTLKQDKKLKRFCDDPSIKRNLKVQVWQATIAKLGLADPSKNMLILMAENGRLDKIINVAEVFATLMSAHRGEVMCIVKTAKPLDNASTKELNSALQGLVGSGHKINLKMEVDPSIIGGMIVSVGDKMVDMSVARKMRLFEQAISMPA